MFVEGGALDDDGTGQAFARGQMQFHLVLGGIIGHEMVKLRLAHQIGQNAAQIIDFQQKMLTGNRIHPFDAAFLVQNHHPIWHHFGGVVKAL